MHLDRWHFGRRVGHGAFGKVYKAWDADQRMVVAVKEVCRIGDSPDEFQRVTPPLVSAF